jgi:hypothetical protein
MQINEPEALAEPRRWKSANASGSISLNTFSTVQVSFLGDRLHLGKSSLPQFDFADADD